MSTGQVFDRFQEAHWGARANRRAYDHPVVRAFAKHRLGCIRNVLGSWKPRSVLDVGCGDGFGMWHMQGLVSRVRGCDRSRRMLNENPIETQQLVQANAYALPFMDASFDLVYCWELLHHVSKPQQVVAEMSRVSSRGVLLCEPNCLNPAMALFGIVTPHERGLLRFPYWRPAQLLRRAGLTALVSNTVGWFTPNNTPAFIARIFSRLPYRMPLLGMYVICIGFRPGNVG